MNDAQTISYTTKVTRSNKRTHHRPTSKEIPLKVSPGPSIFVVVMSQLVSLHILRIPVSIPMTIPYFIVTCNISETKYSPSSTVPETRKSQIRTMSKDMLTQHYSQHKYKDLQMSK